MAEDLEYHATFPPNLSTNDKEGGGEFSAKNGRTEPLVILLGWVGCVDKHLAKYSAIYQSKGYATIRYTAPPEQHFYKTEKLQETAVKILELIFDLGLEESPIFFHLFSNGGCALYRHITETVHGPFAAEFSGLNIAGCVFDSCPTKPTLASGIRAMSASDPKAGFFTKLARIILFVILNLLSVFVPSTWEARKIRKTYIKALKEDLSRSPQLFLYSKADAVCPVGDVEDVIAARGDFGVDVWQVCWDDSAHCSHLLRYKEDYLKVCHDFTDMCLEKINNHDATDTDSQSFSD